MALPVGTERGTGAERAGTVRATPRLRGWLPAAMAPTTLLVVVVFLWPTPVVAATVGSVVFAVALLLNFTVSAALHCGSRTPQVAQVLTRLDHASIFLLIAAAYTSIATLLVRGHEQVVLLAIVWTGAVVGALARMVRSGWGRRARVVVFLVLGSLPMVFLGDLPAHARTDVLALLGSAVLLYLAGAVVFALRRPDPLPAWFGYHEVFHALVILGFAAQAAALAIAAR